MVCPCLLGLLPYGTNVDEIARLREEAWIGDAVLTLFVRNWLLTVPSRSTSFAQRTALFELFVSNQFLASVGEPTRIEAEIGRVYRKQGVAAAFAFIDEKLLQRFVKLARNRGYRIEAPHSEEQVIR
jgi:23S rRNA maturation mini-RNase III